MTITQTSNFKMWADSEMCHGHYLIENELDNYVNQRLCLDKDNGNVIDTVKLTQKIQNVISKNNVKRGKSKWLD